jgi:pimeloyl-ACP methyl ester carboxylesterase
VLYGEVEPLARVGGPALFEALSAPGSRWVLLPDCGHFAFLEQPVAFRREVLDFLGR